MGPNIDPLGPPSPLGPPKGPLGAKTGPFGGPGVPWRSVKGPKGVIWMRTTQMHYVGFQLARLGCPWGSEGPKRGPGPNPNRRREKFLMYRPEKRYIIINNGP